MKNGQYQMPDFLAGSCKADSFNKWLNNKAQSHANRDKKRGRKDASKSVYMKAIYKAVLECEGKDYYTGEPLSWHLINEYDNEKSSKGKVAYKKKFADLPSVDHVDVGKGSVRFAICSWKVNDAKNDLTYEEFIKLCEKVVKHHKNNL